jgi:FAD/FMN-containing dehydrogenase
MLDKLKRLFVVASVIGAVTFAVSLWSAVRSPIEPQASPLIVNDVTQLNPIAVNRIISPTTTDEIVAAVQASSGPVSIGGARHSMGGQIAAENALFIDMRRFIRIVDFSPERKTITVQAGATWREIQERINPANLSVKIMQSFANFTVGGSLSVNAHGRYVSLGPIILSVREIQVVLADGSVVEASPTRNAEVFYGVIGGYGGLGVITQATLDLVDNVRVKRHHEEMPIERYKQYFYNQVRQNPEAVFHNADIYPDDYTIVNATTYSATDDAVTVPDRLIPVGQSYWRERLAFWIVSEWPLGNTVRQRLFNPIYFSGEPVTWRNYEASYDTAELEPSSRTDSTYVLEEYFVPIERFDDFIPHLREILQRNQVQVINVSIRHSTPDPGSLLAWARSEVFAFVIYYKQGTGEAAKNAVGLWTRELINAALDLGGSYYLPYQPHATNEQFFRAYPRAQEFFALKKKLDPTYKFRSEFWDKYYPYAQRQDDRALRAEKAAAGKK